MQKEIATKKQNLPTKINLEEFADQGTEDITAKDQKLPILKILYANSPVLDESDGKFIEKARQGDIYNEVTGSLYKGKDGIYVVPCYYKNSYNEWADRGDSPGRPIAIHTDPNVMNRTQRGDDGKDRIMEGEGQGNYIEDSGNHFAYILNDKFEPIESVLIVMKSTQKKKSKVWNSMMKSRMGTGTNGRFVMPSWATVYKLSTTKESNSQNSWYGWVIEYVETLDVTKDNDTLQATKEFYEAARQSDIFGKVDFESENVDKTVEEKPTKKQQTNSDDTPF